MINEKMISLGTKRSCIRELFEYGLKRSKEIGPENVFDFSIGNPSVPAPSGVNDSISHLIQTENSLNLHGYTPAAGAPAVRERIAAELSNRYHSDIVSSDIFITCGAAPALTAVLSALNVPNAEIISIAPYFPEYRVFIEYAGEKFVELEADRENFQIQFGELERIINKNTQAIIVNSPNNPSGTIYSRKTLETLASILSEKSRGYGHPIYIIADEPYRELVYDDIELPYIPAIYPDTVICYSYSKCLSLPGERIGYALVPKGCADHDALFAAVAGAARAMGHVCAPSLMQKMIGECFALRPDIETYDRNRKVLYEALTSYGYECVYPKGAFYLFVKAPGGDAQRFSDFAKSYDLLVVPAGDFGCADYFRVATCVSMEMIKKSLPVFEKVLHAFNK